MAKDLDSLKQSRDIRAYLLTKWGRVPTSIWDCDWSIKYKEFSKSYGEAQNENIRVNNSKLFTLSGVGARHGQLSRFPQDILQFLVKFLTPDKLDGSSDGGYFSNYLPTIIDPFAGHNSRAEGVWKCNRNYVGWDISERHNEMNKRAKEELYQENNGDMFKRESQIEFVSGDSRNINYDNKFEMSITSPPFYDIEDYGDEAGQLGKCETYNKFIDNLQIIYNNVFKALKDNSFCVVETNDFRRKGEFITYHADIITILKKAGFIMHDMIICNYGNGFLESFLSDIEANKIVSKNHSYFAVAKKNFIKSEKREQVRERLIIESSNFSEDANKLF
jgi:hypothetical protein